jgi:hypothetical protein
LLDWGVDVATSLVAGVGEGGQSPPGCGVQRAEDVLAGGEHAMTSLR